MTEQPSDSPNEENDRGAGLMIVILAAGAFMCLGSIGGAIFFVSRAARNAAEYERDAAENVARAAAEQKEFAIEAGRYELVAKALVKRLNGPDRIRDSHAADGKPLLSWRVHLLPDLAQADLYKQFKLDEPWDGPNNRQLIPRIPKIYDHSGPRSEWLAGWTYMRGFTHPGSIFEPNAKFTNKDLSPGPDQTLAIFDSADPIEWTKPDGVYWRDRTAMPAVGGSLPMRDSFVAATASGRAISIDRSIQPDVLWQISTRRHNPNWDQLARPWFK